MLRYKSFSPHVFLTMFYYLLSSLAHPFNEPEICTVSSFTATVTVPGPTMTVFQQPTSRFTTVTVLETTTRTIHPSHLSKPLVNPFPKLAEPTYESFDGTLFSTILQNPHFNPMGGLYSTAEPRESTTFDAGLFSTALDHQGSKHVTHPAVYSAQPTADPLASTDTITYYMTVTITVVPYQESSASELVSSTEMLSSINDLTTTKIFLTSFVTIRRTSTILVPAPKSEATKFALASAEESVPSSKIVEIKSTRAFNPPHTTTVTISPPLQPSRKALSLLPSPRSAKTFSVSSSSLAVFSLDTSLSSPLQTPMTSSRLGVRTSTVPVFSIDSSALVTSAASPVTGPASTQHSDHTLSYELSTLTGTAAAPESSGCGEYGNFTLNWDDEPALAKGSQTTYRAVFNPYHQLFFSNGYEYTPDAGSAFSPVSPPNMALFLPNDTQDIGSPYAAGNKPGEIGNGPRASLNAFWFNAYSVYLGCEDGGQEGCVMDIRGYKWDPATLHETLAAQHVQRLPACPGLVDCSMTYVEFDNTFTMLTGIQIWATANGTTPRAFFVDNLDMGWYNNSCAAGLYRITVRK